MKRFVQSLVTIALLLGASCSDRTAVEFNVDEFPEIKPFYDVCGRYKGVTGFDLHIIELSFRPTRKTAEVISALDTVAREEKWNTTLTAKRKRCFVKGG